MVGRGGNSRNWLSPLFMLIHYSMAKYDNIPGHPGYYISRNGKFILDTYQVILRVSNLYWCTQEENMKQMIRDGRSLRGEKNPAWKDRDFEKISQMFAEGKGIIDIAKSLGISRHIVQKSIQLKFKELWQERR